MGSLRGVTPTRENRQHREHIREGQVSVRHAGQDRALSARPEICCVVAMRAMSTRSLIRRLPVSVSPLMWVPRIAELVRHVIGQRESAI